MARVRRKPWLLVLSVLAVCLASTVCFTQSLNHSKSSSLRLRSTHKEDTGGPRLKPPYEFYRLASEAAKRGGLGVEEYLSNVGRLQDEFIKSREIVDRGDFIEELRNAMLLNEFTLVLGGKNLGKTLIRNQTVCEMENEANAKLTIVDVNMREHPSAELFNAILDRVAEKDKDWASNLKQTMGKVASSLAGLASAVSVGTSADKVAAAASTSISSGITALIDRLSSSDKEKTLSSLISDLKGKGNATCIVVDEANQALPVPTDSEAAQRALQYFVMLTKETSIASVVLISSELGYPYRLQACGMNLRDIRNIVIANEVPKEDMLELMVNRWNMSEALAEAFFTYCGGDVDLCCRGVKQLQSFGDNFDPFVLLDCPGLPSCAADPDAKQHLQNLAKQGWSPVYEIEADKAAELIAQKNVGGIVPKKAKAFDLPQGIWEGEHENAVVPSGTLMRWKIARELERVDSMGASSTGTTSPPAVWVRQLREDDKGGFKFVGNAFQVKDKDMQNIDDLKKAIEKEMKLSIAAPLIEIFSQEDGKWSKEEKMSESLRDNDEDTPYGYIVP